MTLKPQFGDEVENGWASENNPTRRGFFVREFVRSGKLNPGRTWEITDGKGNFWELQPSYIGERLKVSPAAREESRPDPRPSPVGREEVARWICRTVRIAQGFKGTAEYTLDDEVHNAWDDWLDEADDLLALFFPADGWRAIETAPKDGTLILACQRPDEGRVWFKAWEQWKGPQTIAWRGYHVNAPGKETWRDAKGSPVLPDLWMPLDALAVQGDAHD